MVVGINNRNVHGFLLIEIMMALALLALFTGVIAYYCSYIYILHHNTSILNQAILLTQQVAEDNSIADKQISITISYNTFPIQLSELPLKHPYYMTTITSSWQGFDRVKHSYSLVGVHYDTH